MIIGEEQIKALDAAYIMPTYARFDLCLVEGKGCRAKDAGGKSYLDFTSGIGVNSLGWCDDAWVEAVSKQAATLQHTSNLYYTQPGAELAGALCKRTGMNKIFFANSGAEANEGAMKAARKYSWQKYGEGRATILTLKNSFHGRTLATLTATGQEQFHQYFDPFLPGIRHVETGDIGLLEAALEPDVCAVMIEAIQGEGGVVPFEPNYLQAVQNLCTERDILFIVDEVQTGVGRTGTFLASQAAGIQPDIITLAKGLGGGLPIGAVLFAEKTSGALVKGDHATTFGANPVACAGALAVLDRIDDAFLEDVTKKGNLLKQGLSDLPGVELVSGAGLMLGVEFEESISAMDVLQKAMEKGLLCLLAKNRLRLLPPLIISEEEIGEGLTLLQKAIEEVLS